MAGRGAGREGAAWTGSVLDPSGRSVLDTDTRVATERGASGGSVARTTFETSPMARRWRRTIEADQIEGQGPFDVWAAVRADAELEAEITLRWGASDPSTNTERAVRLTPGVTEEGFRAARLGRVEADPGRVVLEGWAARLGGTGSLSWDRLWLAPAGSGFVPPVLPLPGSGAATPAGTPTLPQATAAPTLPEAAPAPTMPRASRRVRIGLVAVLVAAVIGAAVAIPLALSGEEEAPASRDARLSPSPAASPSPAEPAQANFSGAYDVTITIDSLSSPVEGLNVGDASTSTWILRSTCPSGPCPTDLIGTDFFGSGIEATGDLEDGVFEGSTRSSLQCSDNQTGEVLFQYTGPGDFRIEITEAEVVDGVPRAIAFEGEFVFRYQAQGAPTGECPATLVERDSVTGTLLQPPL